MIDIEKLLREGKTLEDIGNLVTNEMNAAQLKIDKEKEEAKKKEQERKEAAEAARAKKKALEDARERTVAALKDYLTLVAGEEIHEETVRTSLKYVEESVDSVKNIKMNLNGKSLSLLDIFDIL